MSAAANEVIRLFDELRVPLLRYLRAMGMPLGDGEDVVQEAFLALHRHLLDGKPRHNLPGWLFRVSRNLALKRLTAGSGAPPAAITGVERGPEAEVIELDRLRRIEAVIAALAETDRQCLILRMEGFRYRQIASLLGISLGAVAQSLSRSLSKIARSLDHQLAASGNFARD